MGRFSDETREKILLALRAGNYDSVAATFAGISPNTLYRWLRRGKAATSGAYRQFFEDVMQVQAEVEVSAVNAIRRAWESGDWRAAAEFLARKAPERWSPQAVFRVEHLQTDPLADEGPSGDRQGIADILTPDQIEVFARQMAQIESGRLPPPPEADDGPEDVDEA